MSSKAMFAAGCFWGVEQFFAGQPGVLETSVGYSGGHTINPDYRQVCSGETGHAEVVLLVFDQHKTGFDDLLGVFWQCHDPTTLNRQGPDIGSQYRSAIYYFNEEQKSLAQASKDALNASGRFPDLVVTEITTAGDFYLAEDYHQKYLMKNGRGSCYR